MILFRLVTCYHTPTLHKNAEKVAVIRFFTQTSVGSTVIEGPKFHIFHIHYSWIFYSEDYQSVLNLREKKATQITCGWCSYFPMADIVMQNFLTMTVDMSLELTGH